MNVGETAVDLRARLPALADLPVPGGWLVGGSVRDLLLERPVVDLDLVVEDDPRRVARAIAADLGGAPFPLSERHGAWRVVAETRVVDVARSRGTIAEDLAQRDFTVNAIALSLDDGRLLDPHGGAADLRAGVMRAVSDRAFADDPLRLLRLARIGHMLGFAVDPDTEALARRDAGRAAEPSGERIYMEMRRLLALHDPADGVRLLDRLGALAVVLPELEPAKQVEQSPFHHLDVFEHTLQVIDTAADIAENPGHYLWRHDAALAAALDRTVGDEMPGRVAVRLAALFHDIAKPATRRVSEAGRIGFPGHDQAGADVAAEVLGRWRAAGAVVRYCRILVAEHLRLGFMVRERPLSRRAVYRYAAATTPHTLDSVVLSLADRLATRGRMARQRYLRLHAETADELVGVHLALEAERAPPLLRGDEIARVTGARGPAIARLVAALAEEQAAGAVRTREEALAFLRG